MEWKKTNKKDNINKLFFIKQFSKIKHDPRRGEKSTVGVHKLGRSYVNLVTLFVAVISKLG